MAVSSLLPHLRSWTKSTPVQPPCSSEARVHLYGLRGILAICGIATIFVQTFIPALAFSKAHGPEYQKILRIIFSPVIWSEDLITSFFFVLSCHSIALTFLGSPTPTTFSGSIVRRVIRMVITIALACGIVFGIFGGIGTEYIDRFKEVLPNEQITTPGIPENALVALNSIFDIFWVVRDFYTEAANTFWPTQTVWNLSLIFYQSWTVYFLMILLPYTRPSWHAEGLALFALGTFWMCTWGWYSTFALLLADYVKNPSLRIKLDEGLAIHKRLEWKLPYKFIGGIMMVAGFGMKFTWAVLPQYYNKELILHPYVDLAQNHSVASFVAAGPYARVDNFLVVFGILLLSETSVLFKHCLSWKPLVLLGKRSMGASISPAIILPLANIYSQAFSWRRPSSSGQRVSSCTCIFTSSATLLHRWQSWLFSSSGRSLLELAQRCSID
jgi:hypothetical protein